MKLKRLLLPTLLLSLAVLPAPAQTSPPVENKDKPTVPASPAETAPEVDKVRREKRFNRLDTNKDGSLDKAEFMATKFAKNHSTRAEKRFSRIDKNGDNKLSAEEWLAAPVRKGKGKS